MRKNVALIYGGRGFEHEVSLSGADFVLPLINQEKYNIIPVFIAKDGRWLISKKGDKFVRPEMFDCCECVALINNGGCGGIITSEGLIVIDVAFPLLHGDFGEDGVVQGALSNANIPYVGENLFIGALCLNKVATRIVAERLSIPGAKWCSFSAGDCCDEARLISEEKIGYPLFIKPRALGSSVGAGRADNEIEFVRLFDDASRLGGGSVLVESCVDIDCELEIGVLYNKGEYVLTNVGKVSNAGGFYDYKEKYSTGSGAIVEPSPVIDSVIEDKIVSYTRELVKALEIRSLCRVDFFLDKDKNIYFNEINTMPGFTEKSLYPAMFAGCGISADNLIVALIEGAML